MTSYRFQFDDQEDRKLIIEQNADKYLVEEMRLFEGNFLIFSDVKPIEEVVKTLESGLLEASSSLAAEQEKNKQNERAIMELSSIIAGGKS